jgi:phosphate transport system protein
MERHFDEGLDSFNTNILKMASLAERVINNSVLALRNQDKKLADQVINDDTLLDELEITNEEHAIDLLALYQPMAGDLRFITVGMHVNTELERIGDMAVNISRRVIEISDLPLLKPLVDIPR